MKTITVYWRPFALANMSRDETHSIITWAMDQFYKVCNLQMVWSDRPTEKGHIYIRGWNDNRYGGLAWKSEIWMSTIRNMSGRDHYVAGGIILHEFCHTYARYGFPRWGHTPQDDAHRSWVMHPWGPNDDWFSPEEVRGLQRKTGRFRRKFWAFEIQYIGQKLRDRRAEIEKLKIDRSNARGQERKDIHARILRLWSQQRSQNLVWRNRVAIWQNSDVDGVQTPKITTSAEDLSRKASLRAAPTQPICGCHECRETLLTTSS